MTSFEVVMSYGILMQDYHQRGSKCTSCGREVAFTDVAVRATIESSSCCHHLECFPAIPFLRADTEVVNHVFDRGNKERVTLWIRRHNAGMEFQRLKMMEAAFGRKLVAFPWERHELTAVMQWLSPKDVCTCAKVNRDWYASSWSAEVWAHLRRTDCALLLPHAFSLHPKLQMALTAKSLCSWCNRAPVLSEVVIFCPVTNRPICRECRGSGDFLVTFGELKRRFRMTLNFLKRRKVDLFDYGSETFSYFPMVVDAIVKYRVKRTDKLIQKVRENLPFFVLEACRNLKYSVSSGFPLLSSGEKSKMARYVLALNSEESCPLHDAIQQLRSNFVPNINTDN